MLTKVARPGDYNPEYEVFAFKTHNKIKQVRRLQSLQRCLAKHTTPTTSMQQEWNAILKCRAFAGDFVRWATSHPEVPYLPWEVPSHDLCNMLFQFAKLEVDHDLHQDNVARINKSKYAHFLDVSLGGCKQAHAALRGKQNQTVTTIMSNQTQMGIVEDPGLKPTRIYVDAAKDIQLGVPTSVNKVPVVIEDKDEFAIQVRSTDDQRLPEGEVEISQQCHHIEPQDIADQLQTFWKQYWNRQSQLDQHLTTLLQQATPLPAVDMTPLSQAKPWVEGVAKLKTASSKGVDGISAAELKVLPSQCLHHLGLILQSYTQGFPAWFMVARTHPVPKKETDIRAADTRPITVLAQGYRLWSSVCARHLLQAYAHALPTAIRGFVPGKCAQPSMKRLNYQVSHLTLSSVSIQ